MGFELLDGVKLLTDLPDEGLRCGQVGTVVHIFTHPHEAYEVEFLDNNGRAVAMLPLLPSQIALHSRARPRRAAETEAAWEREPGAGPAVDAGYPQRRL